MRLYRFLCKAFEMTAGIARRECREGNIFVNEVNILDEDFMVNNGDIVETRYEVSAYNGKVTVVIPEWARQEESI